MIQPRRGNPKLSRTISTAGATLLLSVAAFGQDPTRDEPPCVLNEILVLRLGGEADATAFLRGDADGNGALNLTDAILGLNFVFANGQSPPCEEALDADGAGGTNVSDMVFLLRHIFSGGEPPPPPFPECDEAPKERCATETCP